MGKKPRSLATEKAIDPFLENIDDRVERALGLRGR